MVDNSASRPALLDGLARALNAGGRAIVSVYDTGSDLVEKIVSTVGHVTELPEKALDLAERLRSGERKELEKEIRACRARIDELYYEIGRLEAGLPETAGPAEREPLKKLIAEVREWEREIGKLKARLAEIEAAEAAERPPDEGEVKKSVRKAVEEVLRSPVLDDPGEKALFERVVRELLDDDPGVRMLAAAELGRFAAEVAVPVLISAAGFGNPELQVEIINMLVTIGDKGAVPLLKEKLSSPSYRVRTACLRGLYRLADEEELLPLLKGALGDSHPDVRMTAATLLGWKGTPASVAALVARLDDRSEAVRRAAVSALANIGDRAAVPPLIEALADRSTEVRRKALEALKALTGGEISFDVEAQGKALSEAVEGLKQWWEKESGESPAGDAAVEDEAAGGAGGESRPAGEDPGEAGEIHWQDAAGAPGEEAAETEAGPPDVQEDAAAPIPEVEESLANVLSEALQEMEEAEPAEAEEGSAAEGQEDVDYEVTIPAEAAEDLDEEMSFEVIYPDEAEEEGGAEPEPLSESKLKKMLRADLVALCKERGIECDETYTKAEMIKILTRGK